MSIDWIAEPRKKARQGKGNYIQKGNHDKREEKMRAESAYTRKISNGYFKEREEKKRKRI